MNALLKPPAEPDRSHFLGGTDAAAVMGISPWSTPVELWQEKTGRKRKDPVDPMRAKILARGRKLEPFIREMAIEKLGERGLQVELLACNERYQDPEHPFLACEIDFELLVTGSIVIDGQLLELHREHVNADAKSVSGFARKKWGLEDTEDVPIEYAAQFQHGLMITGRRLCLVAALRSFDDVDLFWTRRDQETITGMRQREVEFWINHVLADVAPDPFNFSDIKLLFPLDNGLSVEATTEIAEKVAQLRDIKSRLRDFEEAEEALTFEIGEFISPHAILTYRGKEIATWKGQGRRALDQKLLAEKHPEIMDECMSTSTIRVLRLKKDRS